VPVTPGSLCSGATLPPGYRDRANGNDCNDSDSTRWRTLVLYPDHDGDGVGTPPRATACRGADLPAGYSLFGDDEDDNDPAVQANEDSANAVQVILF
jgi:hypothetical protein